MQQLCKKKFIEQCKLREDAKSSDLKNREKLSELNVALGQFKTDLDDFSRVATYVQPSDTVAISGAARPVAGSQHAIDALTQEASRALVNGEYGKAADFSAKAQALAEGKR